MLKIAKNLELPTDFATQTVAILARKRVGKTYTASVLAEECCENKIPFVVLDPTGAWYGLRSSIDGKSAGYPVIIIGGIHGDIPLEFTAGKTIAEFVVENPGYYVLDLSGSASNAEQDRFATAFAERIYRLKDKHREPLHIFVDEADSFAPQRPMPGQQAMLGAFEAIVRRGGIRGLGITMITQRAAVLNKNVLTQTELLIVLQTTGPQDQKAVEEWVKMNATEDQRKAFMGSIASLGLGEAWVWSPAWLNIFEKVKIRTRRTFNSSATPEVGKAKVEPQKLAEVDLDALRERMTATIEKAEAENPKTLRKEIGELRRQLADALHKVAEKVPAQVTEVPTFPQEFADNVSLGLDWIEGDVFNAVEALERIKKWITEARSILSPDAKTYAVKMNVPVDAKKKTYKSEILPLAPAVVQPAVERTSARSVASPSSATPNDASVSGLHLQILNALAELESFGTRQPDRPQVGFYLGKSLNGGYGKNVVSSLKTQGLLEYPSPGRLSLTHAGRSLANEFDSPTTLSEFHSRVRRHLGGLHERIFDALIGHYPNPVSREELGTQIDINLTGGYGKNVVSALKTAGVLTYPSPGVLQASESLFPEGLR